MELRIFTTELKHRLMTQFNKSVQQYRFHSFWRNRPGILRVCNQLLERRHWTACVSDKDGGFVLVDKTFMKAQVEQLMGAHLYEEIDPRDFRLDTIKAEFNGVMKKFLTKFGLRDFQSSDVPPGLHRLRRHGDLRRLASRILWNIKTHKSAGNVGFRVVHGSAIYPFRTLGRWLSLILRPKLNAHEFWEADLADGDDGFQLRFTVTFHGAHTDF